MRRVPQCISFRDLRVDAQQFCRQLFGLRRRRKFTPQRSARRCHYLGDATTHARARAMAFPAADAEGLPLVTHAGERPPPFEAQGKQSAAATSCTLIALEGPSLLR